MSLFSRSANVAVISFCAAAAMGGFPAGRASGAVIVPQQIETSSLPAEPAAEHGSDDGISTVVAPLPVEPPVASLTELVARYAGEEASGSQLNCLANAVYFEAKGEPLAGQLAVARVVMNRANSGRFASTICGVVKQPSQFSFVHGGGFPAVRSNDLWRKAVGVAQVAMKGLYDGPAPDALYFHARRVSPRWNKHQVAAVGNHIFYR